MTSTTYRKYRNVKTKLDGITFASKKEATRYAELRLLERAGIISSLELQPEIELYVNGVVIGKYRGDFRYQSDGETILEDVKSKATKTPTYRLKKKILSTLGITITEVM